MVNITENVLSVKERIAAAAIACGRKPEEITLVAASKLNGRDAVQEAIRAGVPVCGENRVQELLLKNAAGAYEGAELHFIGHLQKNKVKNVVGLVRLIHSVDTIPLMKEISRAAQRIGVKQDILLEVNIAGEASKSGFSAENLPEALAAAADLAGITVRGLMTVPPVCELSENNRPFFLALKQLFVDNSGKKYDNVYMDFLSMGMSGDFETAIACGSNMVRIGSAVFGPRNYSDSEVPADGLDG